MGDAEMKTKLKYEMPRLANLNDDMSVSAANCSLGTNVTLCCTPAGSCPAMTLCKTGSGASCCSNGTAACCNTWASTCSSGINVQGFWQYPLGDCKPGAAACWNCISGTTARGDAGCGNGSDAQYTEC